MFELIDFLGNVRSMQQYPYRYPAPQATIEFVHEGIAKARSTLSEAEDKRIAGLGIAMPFELWNWADTVGAPAEVMNEWRYRKIQAEVQAEVPFPVYLQNDATSACGAELVFGEKTRVVVDPSEERLQREFAGVKRCFLPMHSILRIDEVEKQGASRISEAGKGANVAAFPVPLFRPGV